MSAGSSDRRGVSGFDRDVPIAGAFRSPAESSSPVRLAVPYFGNCTRPISVAHPLGRDVEYRVRCRNCPGCLRARTYLWRLRSEAEALSAHHNFLFTGTWRDQYHDREPCADEVTRWLKRLRERCASSGTLRYLVCFERHRSGAWHMHALLHSVGEGFPHLVHHSTSTWEAGFSNSKAVNLAGVGYVSKYVAKDLADTVGEARRPRIRASRDPRYGAIVMDRADDIAAQLRGRRVDLGDVHRINLLNIIAYDRNRKGDMWKEMANLVQKSGKLLLGTDREVNRETGEILPLER